VAGEDRFTPGEIRRALEGIDKKLEKVDKHLEDRDKKVHDRINKVEDCINLDVKPRLMQVIADNEWLKRGFWLIAGAVLAALAQGTYLLINLKANGG